MEAERDRADQQGKAQPPPQVQHGVALPQQAAPAEQVGPPPPVHGACWSAARSAATAVVPVDVPAMPIPDATTHVRRSGRAEALRAERAAVSHLHAPRLQFIARRIEAELVRATPSPLAVGAASSLPQKSVRGPRSGFVVCLGARRALWASPRRAASR